MPIVADLAQIQYDPVIVTPKQPWKVDFVFPDPGAFDDVSIVSFVIVVMTKPSDAKILLTVGAQVQFDLGGNTNLQRGFQVLCPANTFNAPPASTPIQMSVTGGDPGISLRIKDIFLLYRKSIP